MSIIPPVRPRFRHRLSCTVDEGIARLESAAAGDTDLFVRVVGHHADIVLPAEERTIWSPHLQLELCVEDDEPVVHGLLAPMPAPWTGYVFSLLSAGTVACFALCFAFVQWMLERPPTAAIVAVVAMAMMIGLHRLSRVGQRATHDQVVRLQDFAASTLGLTGTG